MRTHTGGADAVSGHIGLFQTASGIVMQDGKMERRPSEWLSDDGKLRIPHSLSPEDALRALTVALQISREVLGRATANRNELIIAVRRASIYRLETIITMTFGADCLRRCQDGPIEPEWVKHGARVMLESVRADFEAAMRRKDERMMTIHAERMDRLERMLLRT